MPSMAIHSPRIRPTDSREPHQLCSSRGHRLAVHPPELSDGLVVRIQPAQQPHQLHVAAALCFQPPRRTDLVQITVQIQLQQIARIITRSTSFSCFRTFEA